MKVVCDGPQKILCLEGFVHGILEASRKDDQGSILQSRRLCLFGGGVVVRAGETLLAQNSCLDKEAVDSPLVKQL